MKRWQSVVIAPELALEDAIRVLDGEGLRIALVAEASGRLLGTLTDGDVRRALLRRTPMTAPVREAMYATPKTAAPHWSRERILALMETHQLLQVPVVDADGRLVGLETLHGLLQKQHKDNAVFLMAGGFGTRLQPLTDTCPKPMLKVGDKPILELTLESLVQAGFQRFFISTHYLPEMISDHFGDGTRWGARITYVHEDVPLGTGGAVGLLPKDEIERPMVMMNGDVLTRLDFEALLRFHDKHEAVATMCVREYEHRVPFGVIESDGHRVRAMVEKPVYRHSVNTGIYVLSPALVRSVQRGVRIDMPTLLQSEMDAGRTVNVFPVHEYWLDVGRPEDLQRARNEAGNPDG